MPMIDLSDDMISQIEDAINAAVNYSSRNKSEEFNLLSDQFMAVIEKASTSVCPDCGKPNAGIHTCSPKVAEPTEGAMLDWLIANEALVNSFNGKYWIESVDKYGDIYEVGATGLTGREAIRTAMKAKP